MVSIHAKMWSAEAGKNPIKSKK